MTDQFFTDEEYEIFNDKLADILILFDGFEVGLRANPCGNKEQREAHLKLCSQVRQLIPYKKRIQSHVSQRYRENKERYGELEKEKQASPKKVPIKSKPTGFHM